MNIETSRLYISPPKPNEILILENLWRDTQVREFLGGTLNDEQISHKIAEIQQHWAVHGFGLCSVLEKKSEEMIGLCGLVSLFPNHWNKGFAREASIAICNYAFETLLLNKIIAIIQTKNIKSCRLLENIGMQAIKIFERYGAEQSLFERNES